MPYTDVGLFVLVGFGLHDIQLVGVGICLGWIFREFMPKLGSKTATPRLVLISRVLKIKSTKKLLWGI